LPIAPTVPRDPSHINVQLDDDSDINFVPLQPTGANLIEEDNTISDANIFCFASFADKRRGILCNDLTGPFPFMSLEGNVCSLVLYHYKTNAILALSIAGFSNKIIFVAYQQQFNVLESKGYKIWLSVMDNQGTKIIKK
jgi:hypothetical protein